MIRNKCELDIKNTKNPCDEIPLDETDMWQHTPLRSIDEEGNEYFMSSWDETDKTRYYVR